MEFYDLYRKEIKYKQNVCLLEIPFLTQQINVSIWPSRFIISINFLILMIAALVNDIHILLYTYIYLGPTVEEFIEWKQYIKISCVNV